MHSVEQAIQTRVWEALDRALERLQERERIAQGRLFASLLDLWQSKSQFPWNLTWDLWPHRRPKMR